MGDKIVKSNALVQAGYRLSVMEQRIILNCVAQVDSRDEVTDEVMYAVRVSDISNSVDSYSEVKEAALRLKRREVTFEVGPNGRRKPRKRITGWVQSIEYDDGQGSVQLRFSKDILPFLSQITSHFTTYDLKYVSSMTSSYGVRIYELIAQHRKLGKREIEIDWMKEKFGIEGGTYDRFPDLRRFVIEPALKDINTHSDLKVKCEYKKTGRKTTHIVLTFTEKKPKVVKEYTEKSITPVKRKTKPRLVDQLIDAHMAQLKSKVLSAQ